MKYKSINFIYNYVSNIIDSELEELFKKISEDYNLDLQYIKNKYLKKNNDDLIQVINSKIRCLGIIKSGCQCARTRKHNSEFCLIHQKSLKFGKKHIYPNVDSPEYTI